MFVICVKVIEIYLFGKLVFFSLVFGILFGIFGDFFLECYIYFYGFFG